MKTAPAALALSAAFWHAGAQPSCVAFESPLAGSVFSAPSCTVSLKITCDNVTKIDLQARYFPESGDSAVIVPLGTITRPPYKLIWNTYNLPNQLFTGAGILAEALIGNTEVQIARQEGIFLTHNPIKRKSIPVPYAVNVQKGGAPVAQAFDLKDGQKSGYAVIVWNESGLVISVRVNDNSFYSNQPGRNIADAGLEILLDPARRRSPHPGEGTLFYVVPLSGSPYRIDYSADIEDGAFKLVPQSARINYPHNVALREFKGYDVQFTIPKTAFGKSIPDTLGCNIVLRTLDAEGQVQKFSLNGGNRHEMYSPVTWSEYCRLPKPLHMYASLQWTVFFLAGFLLALAAYMIITKMRKPQLLSNFERSEEEKRAFARVSSIMEQNLVKKNLDIDVIAQKCEMDSQALNTLIKRNTGFTFVNYLQYCRTEVAKERLRSSRSNEKSIADLCGFTNALEMEKCFVKFHHITPYKFRTQQQVA
jgi:AraC-like DNA-binding protein